jgi:hypothetical protein
MQGMVGGGGGDKQTHSRKRGVRIAAISQSAAHVRCCGEAPLGPTHTWCQGGCQGREGGLQGVCEAETHQADG